MQLEQYENAARDANTYANANDSWDYTRGKLIDDYPALELDDINTILHDTAAELDSDDENIHPSWFE